MDAGPNQTVTWPETALLSGTVSDDRLPDGQLIVSWHKVTGPGDVTFAQADTPVTTASFSTPGNYVLTLIADDGALVGHALVAVAVTEPPVQITSLNVRVQFGRRNNSAGQLQDVPFQVTIKNAAGTETLYQTAHWVFPAPITDGNYGTATLHPTNPALVYEQTYQILIRGAMHLQRRVTVTLTEGMRLDLTDSTVNPEGALWGCDLNQDNRVDMADHDIWAAHVQAGATPPPTPDPESSAYRSDVNGDHFINIGDFSICAANMGKVGD